MIFIDDYDDYNIEYTALYRIKEGISYVILKKDCNETVKMTSYEDPAWDIIEQDLKNNDTKIDFVIKGVYDRRYIDMIVWDSKETEDIEEIFENDSESEFKVPVVNVTKTDRIKINNAQLLSFKNAFNAAFIGDPIIFEANEKTTNIKNISGTVNLKFRATSISPRQKLKLHYKLRRSLIVFRYLIDFEIDEDASITTNRHCSNTKSHIISLTKFLNENPDIFSNLDFFKDNIKLENSNGTFILRNFPTTQTSESVIISTYWN